MGDSTQEVDKAGPTEARLLGKVGPTPERLVLGRQKHGQGPATPFAHGLERTHVNMVDVRPLLPVNLDVDEERVHHRRDFRILKALVGHDMAPVTGGVADREEDWPVQALGFGERLRPPFPPRDRVVPVLLQVRRRRLRETVHRACGPSTKGRPSKGSGSPETGSQVLVDDLDQLTLGGQPLEAKCSRFYRPDLRTVYSPARARGIVDQKRKRSLRE